MIDVGKDIYEFELLLRGNVEDNVIYKILDLIVNKKDTFTVSRCINIKKKSKFIISVETDDEDIMIKIESMGLSFIQDFRLIRLC